MKKILLVFKWLFIFLFTLFILALLYEQYARYSAKNNFVDNGTYIEVNGHKMHYVKRGEGRPTVIFESGLDFAGHMSWYKVQEKVSKFATTISYDRAGILRSEKSNKARTCENMAEELHTLLENVEAKKPYVFVAHSLGGLIARCYAKKYADTLSGIVFVDATHPKQLEEAPKSIKLKMKSIGTPPAWLTFLSYDVGITRIILNIILPEFVDDENNIKAIKSEINAFLIKSNQGSIEEAKMFEEMLTSSKDVSFGDIPFTILTATSETEDEDERIFINLFRKLQEESLNLSTTSKLISVKSGHFIQIEKPKVLIEAIREIVEERMEEKNWTTVEK